MKLSRVLVVTLVTFVTTLAVAQNAPLPSYNVTTTFEAASIPGIGQTFAATLADVGVSPTPNSALFFETVQAPAAPDFNGYYGPGFSYQLNFLSKKLNDVSPNLSGFRVRFTLLGSAGEVRVGDRNHFGGNARFRAEYAFSASGKWNLAAEVGGIRLPGVTNRWGKLVAIGLPINF